MTSINNIIITSSVGIKNKSMVDYKNAENFKKFNVLFNCSFVKLNNIKKTCLIILLNSCNKNLKFNIFFCKGIYELNFKGFGKINIALITERLVILGSIV